MELVKMQNQNRIIAERDRAKMLYEESKGNHHRRYMYGWYKALSWVLGEEVTFDDYRTQQE